MSKQGLLNWGLDRHGYGEVIGYGPNGYVGTWHLRTEDDVKRLPEHLTYRWAS